jgi:hypothetical protein
MGLWRDLLYRGLRVVPGKSVYVRVSARLGAVYANARFTLAEKTSLSFRRPHPSPDKCRNLVAIAVAAAVAGLVVATCP